MQSVTTDGAALTLRTAAGVIFLPHGWSKIAGDGGASAFAADMAAGDGIPPFLGHVAAWSEVVGAVLPIAGLLTRIDAILLAGTMFVAAFVIQLPDAMYSPQGAVFAVIRGIEMPLAMFAMAAALVFTGGGLLSLDHALRLGDRVVFLRRRLPTPLPE